MSQKVIRCPDDKLALLLEHGGLNCTSEAKAVAHGIMLDLRDCRAALAAAEAKLASSDELYRAAMTRWNEAASALAEYEGTDGRCPAGHNKRFTYDMTTIGGEVGCVGCERDKALATLADERRHADALLNALHNPDNITVERAIEAHHARRAAEVANG